ncbi:MAG TPA: hypothetical protein VKC60_06300, partial [Opitutaceae bacterium]|nr:hypothetical protein [Opitutaceae bacterium]
MVKVPRLTLFIALLGLAPAVFAQSDYFPPRGAWEHRTPEQMGMDAAKIQQAIDYSIANENPSTKDVALDLAQTFGKREPNFKILGPTKPRGGMTGLVIYH